MKLLILDPDLTSFGGHNFNYLEGIVAETRHRGIDTQVFGFRGIDPKAASALGAVGHFTAQGRSVITDAGGDLETRTAWTHIVLNAVFARDLQALTPLLGPDTLIFVPAASSRQLLALAQWLSLIAPPSLPCLVALLRYDLDAYPEERALLRHPAIMLSSLKRPAILCCETEESAEIHADALGLPFETMPIPLLMPAAAPRRKGPTERIRVGWFGDAREVKGFRLLPAIAKAAQASEAGYELFVQTFLADDAGMLGAMSDLKRLAASAPDIVTLRLGQVAPELYRHRFRDCDVVLISYSPAGPAYKQATSAVLCEAVSLGRTVVVPDTTWMSGVLRRMGIEPAVFTEWRADAIDSALRRVVSDFRRRDDEAQRLSKTWHSIHGPVTALNRLLEWHKRRS